MNIVFATTGGPLGLGSLRTLAAHHRILAVVRPASRSPWWKRAVRRALPRFAGGHPADIVSDWTRRAGVATVVAASGGDERLAERLRRYGPDLLCIAGFPWLFSADILGIPRAGAMNLHPSLLPRHRGPNPFFWTYYHDDREAGATVHLATARADAGPVVAQSRRPLPRGMPVERLYVALAETGAQVFGEAVRDVEAGRATLTPQDETLASAAPRVPTGAAMVNFAWDVERVWHFLAGLNPRFREPLSGPGGRPVRYRGVAAYERCPPGKPPGTAEPGPGGWMLWCRDGAVRLTRRALT